MSVFTKMKDVHVHGKCSNNNRKELSPLTMALELLLQKPPSQKDFLQTYLVFRTMVLWKFVHSIEHDDLGWRSLLHFSWTPANCPTKIKRHWKTSTLSSYVHFKFFSKAVHNMNNILSTSDTCSYKLYQCRQ